MKTYCVVYDVCGIYYRYRCNADTKRQAKSMCCEYMGCSKSDIVEVIEE